MSLTSHETDVKVCRCLRTKTIYGNFAGDFETWHDSVASSAAFWCLKTMGPAGPDEHFVHVGQCGPHRSCYEEPLD
jgi:hypothetical protein